MCDNNPLCGIRRKIDGGSPFEEITVRSLLDLFQAKRRGVWKVEEISSALDALSLTTDPDFRDSWIDGIVRIRPAENSTGSPNAPAVLPGFSASPEDNSEEALRFRIGSTDPVQRIKMLPAANKAVAFVSRDDDIGTAIFCMLRNEYSQLMVRAGERSVEGVITWKSIASRIALGLEHTIVHHCIEAPQVVGADEPLFDVISMIARHGYVLVRARDQKISGIVTASDVSEQFRVLTEPFLLLGQVEQHIRKLLDGRVTLDDLRSVSEFANPDKLSLGDYIRLIENVTIWEKLGMPHIDRASMRADLERIRGIRNDVMHFNPDPLDLESVCFLGTFSRFMQALDEIRGK